MKTFRYSMMFALGWLILGAPEVCAKRRGVSSVTESERRSPVAYDVDVTVIGGSTYGVSAALEAYKGPPAAEPLARFLKQPGVVGHSFLEIRDVTERTPDKPTRSDTSTRNNSLRELIDYADDECIP